RVLTVDCDGKPIDFATWQEDLESDYSYYVRSLGYWFHRCDPDEKEERVQEGIVQIAKVLESEYRLHGGRVSHRSYITRGVAYRVRQGRSSTRSRGQGADLLDRTHRATGPKRETSQHILQCVFYDLIAENTLPPWFAVDLTDWFATLPGPLAECARLAVMGYSDLEIGDRMDIPPAAVDECRAWLRSEWLWQEGDD
ncbi:hypothetical protein LCGC14_1893960, partial [marine sediment metagenome]